MVETAAHLGYSVVAINHVVDFKEKKQEIEKPVVVSELFTTLPIVQGKSRPIKILTRLTIIVTDPSHCNVLRATSSRVRLYDIIAVFPKTEKLFHVACTHLDVDLVCITVTEKLPFYFKRPPVNVAIDRGLGFELVYSPAIKDSTMRRYTISNALNLMQICKGKKLEKLLLELFLQLRNLDHQKGMMILFQLAKKLNVRAEENGPLFIGTAFFPFILHQPQQK
ncbi:Ribonuclease P protein subunit p30 [Heterocephalus glaber]|uniref:Ribonuclease P protein subunit p30 n=1 Tax=Heterocephalus glaber TaxID=10181 RepID=G5B100_HETGA|nr:Ribonuclease P protein subunit p30 [Heterocephalus glaber]